MFEPIVCRAVLTKKVQMKRLIFLGIMLSTIGVFGQVTQPTTEQINSNQKVLNIQPNSIGNATNNSNSAPILNSENFKLASDSTMDLKEAIVVKGKIRKEKSIISDAYSIPISAEQEKMTAFSNSFQATKMAASKQRTQRSPTTEQQQQMDVTVEQMQAIAPNSPTTLNAFYQAGNYNVQRENALHQSYEIAPGLPETEQLLVANSIVKGDTNKAMKHLQSLRFKNIINDEEMNYSNDLLNSAEGNDILITHGFADTYASYLNQIKSKKLSLDVVSLDLLQSENYRELLTKKGYSFPSSSIIDVGFLSNFCQLNYQKKIALSMTIPNEYLKPISDNISVYGLVFEYRPNQNFQTMENLENLYFSRLNKTVFKLQSPEAIGLSKNYLPTNLLLQEYYKSTNQTAKAKKMQLEYDSILQRANTKFIKRQ